MTPTEFLTQVVEEQKLDSEQLERLKTHKTEVEATIRENFGSLPVIKYAGSKAKGTMIKELYDLDIVCYFPSDHDKSLREIYEEIANLLEEKYEIDRKTSAIRILRMKDEDSGSYHIDVVPGRFISDDTKDVFIYISTKEGERQKTNLKTHLDTIRDSKCHREIKLLKLWSVNNGYLVRTFFMEILAIEALQNAEGKSLHTCMLELFRYIRDNIETVCIEDPANPNNVVSELVDDVTKKKLAKAAKLLVEEVEEADNNEAIVKCWEKALGVTITKEEKNVFFPSSTGVIIKSSTDQYSDTASITPNRPWRQ